VVIGERRKSGKLIALAAAAFVIAAVPSAAYATTYNVSTTGDGADVTPGNDVCEVTTAAGDCTLRAAIGEANAHAGTDSIGFLSSQFDGVAANSTIVITAALPTITGQTFIDGGACLTGGGDPKPCAGVQAGADPTALGPDAFIFDTSGANGSSLKRIAITNAFRAVIVLDTVDGFAMEGTWLGQNLDEDTQGLHLSNSLGIFALGRNQTIGGTDAAARNLFRSNGTGILLSRGLPQVTAQNSTVTGNYFGTTADGEPANSLNGDSIQMSGTLAAGNVIGGADTGTPGVCDGACNLLAKAAFGGTAQINLNSASPAAPGPTTIKGNFLGIDADGDPAFPANNNMTEIHVGDADNVTIGGPAVADRNFIGGGNVGISAGDDPDFVQTGNQPDDLVVQNNFIGVPPDGSGEAALENVGVVLYGNSAAGVRPQILDNNFAGDMTADQDGIRLEGTFGNVQGNTLGADTVPNSQPFGGDAIELSGTEYELADNAVTNGQTSGVNITGSDNSVSGNTIEDNGVGGVGPGLRIQGGASNNLVGPSPLVPAGLNVFGGNEGDAIELLGDGTDFNSLLGNVTDGVTAGGLGLFIDLGGDSAGNSASGPNEGIGAPTIVDAAPTLASGTALPGATVTLYESSASTQDPVAVLGQATADGSGSWVINYPAISPTLFVRANQTNAAASSSELTNAVDLLPPDAMPTPPVTNPNVATGRRAAALKKCKKKKTKAARMKCKKKANKLPV
jgi:hypothetical protein